MNRLPSPRSLRRRLLKHLTEVEERLYRAMCEAGEAPDPSLAREMRQYAAQVLEVLQAPDAAETAPGGITLEDIRRAYAALQESAGDECGASLGTYPADACDSERGE